MYFMLQTALAAAQQSAGSHEAVICGHKITSQHDKWSCGLHALRCCLIMHGKAAGIRWLKSFHVDPKVGTSTDSLRRIASAVGFTAHVEHCRSSRVAYDSLTTALREKRPVIVSVLSWTHWITVITHTSRGFLVYDSGPGPGPTFVFMPWRMLSKLIMLTEQAAIPCEKHRFKNDKRPIYELVVLSKRWAE